MKYRVLEVPVGPESKDQSVTILFKGGKEEALVCFAKQREESFNGRGLVLTDGDGLVVFACS